MRLQNEVAIITGSTKGLGRFIAERYAEEGAKVVVTGRTEAAGAAVIAAIAAKGGDAIFIQADLSVEKDIERLVRQTVERFGRLTIMVNNGCPTELVYNAATNERTDGSIRNATTEGWNSLLLGTLTQVFWCCKYAAPELEKSGGGSIINVSSIAGMKAMGGCVGYSSGKSGLFGLTRSVAVEEAVYGTRCNCIVVGTFPPVVSADGIRSDGGPPRAVANEGEVGAFGQAMRDAPLLGPGKGEDMADLCLFLGSRESRYLTGLVVPIDGGWSIKSFVPSVDVAHREATARAQARA